MASHSAQNAQTPADILRDRLGNIDPSLDLSEAEFAGYFPVRMRRNPVVSELYAEFCDFRATLRERVGSSVDRIDDLWQQEMDNLSASSELVQAIRELEHLRGEHEAEAAQLQRECDALQRRLGSSATQLATLKVAGAVKSVETQAIDDALECARELGRVD